MHEFMLWIPAAGLPGLVTAYWVCLVLGGGLLLISSLSGSDADAGVDADVDFDADLDADFDADVDVDAEPSSGPEIAAHHAPLTSLATWFSVQFAVFFMAVFGVIGVTLTHLTGIGRGVVLAAAVAGGFVVGQAMHQLLRILRLNSGNSAPQQRDYVNKLARVTVAIRQGKKGEIRLLVRRGERFIPAVSQRLDEAFDIGKPVVVVEYRAGIAQVVSPPEFEALNNHRQGASR